MNDIFYFYVVLENKCQLCDLFIIKRSAIFIWSLGFDHYCLLEKVKWNVYFNPFHTKNHYYKSLKSISEKINLLRIRIICDFCCSTVSTWQRRPPPSWRSGPKQKKEVGSSDRFIISEWFVVVELFNIIKIFATAKTSTERSGCERQVQVLAAPAKPSRPHYFCDGCII